MAFLKSVLSGAGLIVAMTAASPSYAAEYLFGYSGQSAIGIVNGATVLTSFDQGWYNNTGEHGSDNSNYIVETNTSYGYNNYFTFDLRGVTSQITSFSLNAARAVSSFEGRSLTYSLYRVSTSFSDLDVTRFSGDQVGQEIYADLGSGVNYGSQVFTASELDTPLLISFNANGLAALNAARGGFFSVGGSLGVMASAVPETATWAMMLVGFAMVGATARYRRPKVAVTIG